MLLLPHLEVRIYDSIQLSDISPAIQAIPPMCERLRGEGLRMDLTVVRGSTWRRSTFLAFVRCGVIDDDPPRDHSTEQPGKERYRDQPDLIDLASRLHHSFS